MKYYIISGEASGDLHGANLIKAIKQRDHQAEIRAWGGDLMQSQGAEIIKHYKDLAFMGFAEVIMNLRTILSNISFCKNDILGFKPDVLILIDYPGFNLRIAEFAKKQGFKVVYYISPQVWAWKKSRVHKIKKFVDKMLVILPFEQDFYKKYNYETVFVGHPLLDEIGSEDYLSKDNFIRKHSLSDKPIIALLPGSRKQEVTKMLRILLSARKYYPDYQFVISGVNSLEKELYSDFTHDSDTNIIFNDTHNLVKNATAALVTSGTATLETAIIGTPQVVCYKGNRISYEIARRIVDIKFISLVNLIMDKEVVKELIQHELNTKNLKVELDKILDNNNRNRILEEYKQLRIKLGKSGASENAAVEIMKVFKN